MSICSGFIAAASAAFGQVPTDLLVPRRGNNLREAAAAALLAHVRLQSIAFTRGDDPSARRDVFLHAKFYALASGSRVHLYVGSANASWAALTSAGDHGNAELLASLELDAAAYREHFLQELEISAEPPELSAAPGDDDDDDPPSRLQILAARLAGGVLRVAFTATGGVTVTSCLLDGAPARGFIVRAHILEVPVSGPPPRTVELQGLAGDQVVASMPGWIDQEDALQVGSTARALAEKLRETTAPWLRCSRSSASTLQILPPPSAGSGAHDSRVPADSDLTFTRGDVFPEIEFPDEEPSVSTGLHNRAMLLAQLMLRWFHGLESAPHEDDDPPGPASDQPINEDGGPTPPQQSPPPSPPAREPGHADRKRFERLTMRLQASMTDPSSYSVDRPRPSPPTSAWPRRCCARACASIGSTPSGSSRSPTTSGARSSFSAPGTPGSGAIEIRYRDAPDRAAFRRALGAEQVTAALAAWALTDLPPASAGPRHARFVLAALLSVARTEWLWAGGDVDVVARELGAFLKISGEDRQRVAQAWRTLTRRGQALGRLEKHLRTQPLATWRARVTQRELACGELLWQDQAGWGITTAACLRVGDVNVPVLKLHGDAVTPTNFRATWTVPIRELVPADLAAPIAEILADFGAP